ncbi:DNA (cytosine-5-)-methyltransferase [Streptomyces sp. NPDC055157]
MGAFYEVKLVRSDYLRLPAHDDACPSEQGFARWCEERVANGARLAVDLFSGAGGLSLGVEDAGWTVAAAVDHDERALETHRHNFPGLSLRRDLGDRGQLEELIELLKSVPIDLIAGGPPCQPFSRAGLSKIRSLVNAGKRDEHDHRKELWQSYLEVVLAVRPRVVLMENVPDMGLGDDFRVVRSIEQALENAGYYTQVRLVDAWRYGVPQHRKRLILLARLDSHIFTWPDEVKEFTTLRHAIGDLPPIPEGEVGGRESGYSCDVEKRSDFANEMRSGIQRNDVLWDHMGRPVRDDDKEIFALMDSKSLYTDIPERLRRYSSDNFTDKYKKLAWDEVSRTITAHIAKDGYWYIHPAELRTLSVRESARVQTFPDRFRFAGMRSDAFRQIGNAVPPKLGKAAAIALQPISGDSTEYGEPVELAQVRENLHSWAGRQRRKLSWHQVPGPGVKAPAAVISAVLSHSRILFKDLNRALSPTRGALFLSHALVDEVASKLPSQRSREALARLLPLCDDERRLSVTEICESKILKPSEKAFFQLLMGQDLLLINQGSLRVAATFAGSESDQTNKLSDGRIDLARLVGSGPRESDTALRMAGVRLLGATVCRAIDPVCGDCPLREHCAGRVETLDGGE